MECISPPQTPLNLRLTSPIRKQNSLLTARRACASPRGALGPWQDGAQRAQEGTAVTPRRAVPPPHGPQPAPAGTNPPPPQQLTRRHRSPGPCQLLLVKPSISPPHFTPAPAAFSGVFLAPAPSSAASVSPGRQRAAPCPSAGLQHGPRVSRCGSTPCTHSSLNVLFGESAVVSRD